MLEKLAWLIWVKWIDCRVWFGIKRNKTLNKGKRSLI